MTNDEIEMFLNVEFALWASRPDINYDGTYDRLSSLSRENFINIMRGAFAAGVATGLTKAGDILEGKKK